MRCIVLLIFIAASPLFACCPKDTDTLGEEVDDARVLDLIAGVNARYPDAWYEAKLRDAEGALDRAEWLDQLNRQAEALNELGDADIDEADERRTREVRFRLAVHLWWRGGEGEYTPERCIEIARATREGKSADPFFDRLLRWMELNDHADPDSIHPDIFSLRLMTNKKSAVATGQLAEAGLSGLDKRLLSLIELHPVWENFDTFHALTLAYAVEGKQNLSHYARLRAWEFHGAGEHSRVPGSDELEDIRSVTMMRERIGGVNKPVRLVTDENLPRIEAQFAARREYAAEWQRAVREHATNMLTNGQEATPVSTWDAFRAPAQDFPPLQVSAATTPSGKEAEPAVEEEERRRGGTWIMLGVLVAILGMGAFAKARIDRSARAVVKETEEGGEGS